MVEGVDLLMLKKFNYDVKTAFLCIPCLLVLSCTCMSGCQSHANCTRVAAIRMQINPVAASRMQILMDFIHVACNWRPRGYNLHANGGRSGTIYMRLAVTRVQFICDWMPFACKLCVR
jgi:hypothetical protein